MFAFIGVVDRLAQHGNRGRPVTDELGHGLVADLGFGIRQLFHQSRQPGRIGRDCRAPAEEVQEAVG